MRGEQAVRKWSDPDGLFYLHAKWYAALVESTDPLSATDLAVAWVMIQHADKTTGGNMWPSAGKIARRTRRCVRTVKRSRKKLLRLGVNEETGQQFIRTVGGHNYYATVYRLTEKALRGPKGGDPLNPDVSHIQVDTSSDDRWCAP